MMTAPETIDARTLIDAEYPLRLSRFSRLENPANFHVHHERLILRTENLNREALAPEHVRVSDCTILVVEMS